jgi:hypothetical protein
MPPCSVLCCPCQWWQGPWAASDRRALQDVYQLFLDQSGANAAECVFFDDAMKNVVGAKVRHACCRARSLVAAQDHRHGIVTTASSSQHQHTVKTRILWRIMIHYQLVRPIFCVAVIRFESARLTFSKHRKIVAPSLSAVDNIISVRLIVFVWVRCIQTIHEPFVVQKLVAHQHNRGPATRRNRLFCTKLNNRNGDRKF